MCQSSEGIDPWSSRSKKARHQLWRKGPGPKVSGLAEPFAGERCGCPTGNPSAAVRRAASGSHYTRNHLLFTKPSRSRGSPASSGSGL